MGEFMLRATITVILATAVAVFALDLPAAGQTSAGRTRTLKLDSRFTYSHTSGKIELATDKLSVGQLVVGHDVVDCIAVKSTTFECSFTETINGQGTLQAEGLQGTTNAPAAMAIVGGTRAYTGASGTMTTSDENTSVEHYQLRYTLPSG
jgi:hypothetical protein